MKNVMCIKNQGSRLCRIILLSLLIVFVFSLSSTAVMLAEEPGIKITVNGSPVDSDVAPFMQDNRVMVPIRFVGEALGAAVNWNQEAGEATVSLGSTLINIFPLDHTVLVNGKTVELDVHAVLLEGRVFVPLRFIAENLGSSVDWNQESQTVIVNSLAPVTPVTPPPTNNAIMPTQKMSLLEGRLSISMPQGAVQEILYGDGIMSASPAAEEKTLLFWGDGELELYVQAQELFCYSTGDILKDLGLLYGSDAANYTSSTFTSFSSDSPDSVRGAVMQPQKYTVSDGLFFLGDIWVIMPDNMLVVIRVYASDDLFADSRSKQLMNMLCVTINYGERQADLSARRVQLEYDRMTIDVAEGYSYVARLGTDFSVYYIEEVVTVGEEYSYMGIYCGWHSSFPGIKTTDKTIVAPLLGEDTLWLWQESPDGYILLEALVDADEEYEDMQMNVFINALNEEDLQALLEMAKSITFLPYTDTYAK